MLRKYTLWGSAELQNAENNHGNLISVSRSVIYNFLFKQKQKQTLSSKWKKYCTANVSIFSKAEMNRLYSPSDSDIDASKQASSNKNTKKPTLSWMRVFNNWTITHSYTEEIHTCQPEDLNPILEKLYAELRKTNEVIMNHHV